MKPAPKTILQKVMIDLGRLKSPAKAAAAKRNGRKGGRPRHDKIKR